ncbi:MAG: EcsC family protein [Verrucomicrobiales bacterium]
MPLPDPDDQRSLERAFALLEEPSFAAKATRALGEPVAQAMTLLPAGWSEKVTATTEMALSKALDAAVLTMRSGAGAASSHLAHKIVSGLSGAAGGAFGLPALTVELPLSLVIMLRSIADIARSEGELVRDPTTKLACLEVLALGGVGETRDPRRHGYYAIRLALASAVGEATRFVAQRGVVSHGAPPLVRLITQIAGRLSVQVTEKAAAQALPLIGAAGGAIINLMFLDHFQDMARGHFAVRRLERRHGQDATRAAYEALRQGP